MIIKEKNQGISEEDKSKLEEIYHYYLNNELVLKMKEITIHRGTNCYVHSFKVAKEAIKIALKRKHRVDLEAILVAAILHDYYLYSWRKDRSLLKKHGSRHPKVANENAKRDFNISDSVSEIILSHMWPYSIKPFPKKREAKIVSFADKIVALRDAFTSKKHKEERAKNEDDFIKTLFDNK